MIVTIVDTGQRENVVHVRGLYSQFNFISVNLCELDYFGFADESDVWDRRDSAVLRHTSFDHLNDEIYTIKQPRIGSSREMVSIKSNGGTP